MIKLEVRIMSWLHDLARPEILAFLVGAVAIIVVGTVSIVKRLIAHRERMAMIEQGIHPDHPPEDDAIDGPASR